MSIETLSAEAFEGIVAQFTLPLLDDAVLWRFVVVVAAANATHDP